MRSDVVAAMTLSYARFEYWNVTVVTLVSEAMACIASESSRYISPLRNVRMSRNAQALARTRARTNRRAVIAKPARTQSRFAVIARARQRRVSLRSRKLT